MGLKKQIKRLLLKYKKSIHIDKKSEINYGVVNETINPKYPCNIFNSICNFKVLNEGCKVSEARCYGNVSLGRFVSITGPGTVLNSIKEEIQIGSFSSIGQNVCIVDFNHSFDRITSSFINNKLFGEHAKNEVTTNGSVLIEEDVWIGSNVVITSGIKIGRGAVIGAGSVVTKDIPQYSVAFGNPAVVRSKRFDEDVINYLEDLKWWEWDTKKILNNIKLFNINLHNYSSEKIARIIN